MLLKPISGKRSTVYLLLACFLLVAYLPLSSFLFALKNDALTANFPNKYFFSAALHSGHFPLWNPYVNFGLPLYADPGFAYWNPITWFFGCIGYNLYTLTLEVLFYIWLGGIFAFELGKWLGNSKTVAFCIAIMYMCCGFFIGNLQHVNFLTCAAFLPLVVKSYLDLQKSYTLKKLFCCLLGLYLMATAGHPAIPFACLYFLFFIQLAQLLFRDSGNPLKLDILQIIRTHLLLLGGFLLVAAPLLYAYYTIYPNFTRSVSVIQSRTLNTGFDLPSYLSFLFPFSLTGNDDWLRNDGTMRNGYFSVFGLACFMLALLRRKDFYQKVFLLAGALMLVLSVGGRFKEIAYARLPFLDHIRTNGELRVFALLSFILAGARVLGALCDGKGLRQFNLVLKVFAVICILLICSSFIFSSYGFIFTGNHANQPSDLLNNIKWWLSKITFFDRLFLNAVAVLLFVLAYFLLQSRLKPAVLIPLFVCVDLIGFCWIHLPVTGVQMRSPATIQHYFSSTLPGIPIPRLLPISRNQYSGEDVSRIIGCWSYYSKQPGTPVQCDYPTRLNNIEKYFASSLPDSINHMPFVFVVKNSNTQSIRVMQFSGADMTFQVNIPGADSLVLLQNYFPGWSAEVNGNPVEIQCAFMSFMQVPLRSGKSVVRFNFSPPMNNGLLLVWALLILLLLFFFMKGKNMQRN